jgi:hypothetical protein
MMHPNKDPLRRDWSDAEHAALALATVSMLGAAQVSRVVPTLTKNLPLALKKYGPDCALVQDGLQQVTGGMELIQANLSVAMKLMQRLAFAQVEDSDLTTLMLQIVKAKEAVDAGKALLADLEAKTDA